MEGAGQEVGAPAYFAYSTTLVCTSMHTGRDEHPLAALASLKGYEEASELLFEAIRISAAGCCLFLMIFDILAAWLLVTNVETIGIHFRGRASL